MSDLLVQLPNTYNVPPVDGGTAPLSDPAGTGHAALHNNLGTAVNNLREAVQELQDAVPGLAADTLQARLSTELIAVPGDLAVTGAVLLPIIWNLSGRTVHYDAARITVMTPPQGAAIWVDLLTGARIDTDGTNQIDLNPANLTSILGSPLVIARGQYFSNAFDVNDFDSTAMLEKQFVVAIILQVGSSTPGADLSIQLNRLL